MAVNAAAAVESDMGCVLKNGGSSTGIAVCVARCAGGPSFIARQPGGFKTLGTSGAPDLQKPFERNVCFCRLGDGRLQNRHGDRRLLVLAELEPVIPCLLVNIVWLGDGGRALACACI